MHVPGVVRISEAHLSNLASVLTASIVSRFSLYKTNWQYSRPLGHLVEFERLSVKRKGVYICKGAHTLAWLLYTTKLLLEECRSFMNGSFNLVMQKKYVDLKSKE